MAQASDKVSRHETMLVWMITAAIMALLLVVATYVYKFRGSLAPDQSTWGQFGDYLGGVLNPIFALFALFALLYTIVLQVRELNDTRLELSRATQAAQMQTFENTVFQLLQLQRHIVGSWQVTVKTKGEEHIYTGNKAQFNLVWMWIQEVKSPTPLPEALDEEGHRTEVARISKQWNYFLRHEYGQLGHYFRNLYAILKYIDASALPIDKAGYVGIVRSQISGYEFALLFYNCLVPRNSDLKKLVEKYSLLEHMNTELDDPFIPIPPAHYLMYDRNAYGMNPPPVFGG